MTLEEAIVNIRRTAVRKKQERRADRADEYFKIAGWLEMLKQYSDTGLTPGEAVRLKEYQQQIQTWNLGRVQELLLADKEGRLQVLPKPPVASDVAFMTQGDELFQVFDMQTGKEADIGQIAASEDWARELTYCDMEGFAIGQDGALFLLDECNNSAYVPPGRFQVVPVCHAGMENSWIAVGDCFDWKEFVPPKDVYRIFALTCKHDRISKTAVEVGSDGRNSGEQGVQGAGAGADEAAAG